MSAGAILPRDPHQSPKGNWRALKAGLIKNDFAAPAEQWARREKLSIEESKMECHIKPSLKKNIKIKSGNLLLMLQESLFSK